ncbi:hypothetical protein AOLI_G00093780 [Acnodon oligacanthus]
MTNHLSSIRGKVSGLQGSTCTFLARVPVPQPACVQLVPGEFTRGSSAFSHSVDSGAQPNRRPFNLPERLLGRALRLQREILQGKPGKERGSAISPSSQHMH